MGTVTIRHLTRYRYRKPVAFGEHRMMFRPIEAPDQQISTCSLQILPEPVELRHVRHASGNALTIAKFDKPASELCFESLIELEHCPAPVMLGCSEDPKLSSGGAADLYDAEEAVEVQASLERRYADPSRVVERWASRFLKRGRPSGVLGVLSGMTHAIHREFAYAHRLSGAAQDPIQTLLLRSGSCRDFAMLMIEAARSLGLAARFVSGYIYNPRSSRDLGRKGGGHTHAWVSIFVPRHGWVDFDPTNGIVGSEGLVRVAVTLQQSSPLTGSWDGDTGDFLGMEVEVHVEPQARQQRARRAA